ncbi:HdeD family acid-resistance protein [Cellulomonas humilata]|uniref:Uncharacterized membrane protein HdeD (DUF308 family) n=1 Tax=Cellulomonas humilata TaxID=144055 RepID=A0ABU0EC79_9CELL|nr:DUF308 domain-containing protein [Cellulomonas humilata]MDQ0372870.1 uncharacterized membrane protein HdeD (DUF308 family) [Cellulomonas humilata]
MSDDLTTADISSALSRSWWLPVLRGVVLLVLGLLMLVQPLWSVTALVWIFGIFAILDGIVAVVEWFVNRKDPGAGWFLLSGLFSLTIGIVVVVWTPETAQILFYLIAGWVLILGILGIIAAVVLYRARDAGWYWVLTFGLVNFLFGLLMLTHPQTVVSVVVVLLGIFAFVGGVILIVSGFATKGAVRELGTPSADV